MKILFLDAVDFELDAARRAWGGTDAVFLVGGVGADATRKALGLAFSSGIAFDRVVNIGIAGSDAQTLPIGTVVQVVTEQHGDSSAPKLRNPEPWTALDFLPRATGRTLQVLDDRWRQDPADVETMEGAAFFEVCLERGVPFAEIRVVSNQVGERDHARWDIPLALQRLEEALKTLRNES